MRVVCKTRVLDSHSEEWLLKRFGQHRHIPGTQENLSIGSEYTVYGIVFWRNAPWYYLCPNAYPYPKPYALDFFGIVDVRLSRYWRLSTCVIENAVEPTTTLVFEEWAADHTFYERLVDGDHDAEMVFERYRQLMDHE